ncbi:MAG: MerR family transcriptional regulator [Pirellulaceae bacterium]
MPARYTAAMLADLVGVDTPRVRSWQRRGWIVPAEETHRLAYFDFSELTVARQLAALHQAGIKPATIARKLAEIQKRAPQVQRPLADLAIVLDGRQVLVREGDDLLEPGGQLRIDFAALESEAHNDQGPLALVSPAVFLAGDRPPADAAPEQLAQWAAQLDEAGELAAAADMYRAAMAAGGPQPELSFQLAEVLYRAGDLAAARERYYLALELDENYVEARMNLGCLLAELGQPELAAAAFEGTLGCHEAYADAHYHLARTLDDLQRPGDAAGHWRRFLELAPESPWADEAHDRLASAGR